MEIFQNLPYEIKEKIFMYAIPNIDNNFKKAIYVQSCRKYSNKIYNNWLCETSGLSWGEYLKKYYNNHTEPERYKRGLLNCGCCLRHSNGIYNQPHNKEIIGSQCIHKFENDYTLDGKKCTCSCRIILRGLLQIE